jgi:hypothetical protein
MTTDHLPARDRTSYSGRTTALPFDTSVANQARVYDYLLGGKDNYAADRAAAERSLALYPHVAFTARANRAFLGRAVRHLVQEAGIRQFLDVGTGIPTKGNIHQVAQAIAPETRVLYADYDPIVLAHSRALLTSHKAGATEYIEADLRDTASIIGHARQFLNLSQPVAVTLLAILHAIPDSDDPHQVVATLLDAVPAGSYLAVSHPTSDSLPRTTADEPEPWTGPAFQQQFTTRSRAEVTQFFAGMDLVDPGIVRLEQWRPDKTDKTTASDGTSYLWCAVGRKR